MKTEASPVEKLINYPIEQGSKRNVEILSVSAFAAEFVRLATVAKKRVMFETMYALASHFTNSILNSMMDCALRGVEPVLLVTDGMGEADALRNQIFARVLGPHSIQSFYAQMAKDQRKALGDSDVVERIDRPFTKENFLVFAKKRNHFKMAVIDDMAWVGGLNAGRDSDFSRIDCMMRVTTPEIVEEVAQLIATGDQVTQDYARTFEGLSLTVDAGVSHKSLILDNVIEQISTISDPAQAEIMMLTPWVPDGKLLDVMFAVHQKGTKITILTNRNQLSLGAEAAYVLVKRYNEMVTLLKGKQLPILFTPLEVHGKVLWIKDSKAQFGMVTSHNFTNKGVVMGTKEVALSSSNQDFVGSCADYLTMIAENSRILQTRP